MVTFYLEKVGPTPTDLAKDIAEKLKKSMTSTSPKLASTSNVEATPDFDPALQDTAVVSCRRQSDDSGKVNPFLFY